MVADPQRCSHVGRVALARTPWRDVLASYLVVKGLRWASPHGRNVILHECSDEWRASVAAQLARTEKRLTTSPRD